MAARIRSWALPDCYSPGFSSPVTAGLFFNQRVAEAIPTEKSIAVLPFENISANKDDAYFADGVQDEILNNLAKIAQLKVISRTSVMQYRADTKRDLRQIATALGVGERAGRNRPSGRKSCAG